MKSYRASKSVDCSKKRKAETNVVEEVIECKKKRRVGESDAEKANWAAQKAHAIELARGVSFL